MRWIFLIALFGLFAFCSGLDGSHPHNRDECDKKNIQFAVTNAHFIQCAMQHDHVDKERRLQTYCLACSEQYSNASQAFYNLTHDNPEGESCRPIYVDNNLLNLADTLWLNTQRIWDMAVCSDCFEGKCDEATPDKKCDISNRTQDFVLLYKKAFSCINSDNDPCKNCTEQYNNLSVLYNKIRRQTGDKFCFDLKNMMNETQKEWTNKNCCEDKNPPVVEFYTLSASSFFVAIFFYAAAFIYGRRKEAIQFIPDDLLPIDHSRSANDSSTSLSDNEQPLPSTSTNILEPPSKHFDSINETDDDEEPIISHPISNPNLIEI